MVLSPSWAMSGQAIDGSQDPHLAPGVHFRVLINPWLGLPLVPLSVGKAGLGALAKGYTRTDVTWVDSHGTVLSTPFTVTADNPVTGYLPPDATCCWAMIDGEAARFVLPLPTPPRPFPGPVIRNALPADLGRLTVLTRAFALTGMVATPLGDAPVAIRSQAPYHVYASHIERLVVTGAGTVRSVAWLPASAVRQVSPFTLEPLPTPPGARYAGPANGPDVGKDRVATGAPRRRGMHEAPSAADPASCPPATVGEETDRVARITDALVPVLDRLVNDQSLPAWQLTADEIVLDDNGHQLGVAQRAPLHELLQAAVDPGVARWLGLLDVDQEPGRFRQPTVVAYCVDALFAPDWDTLTKAELTNQLSGAEIFLDAVSALKHLADLNPQYQQYFDQAERFGPGPFVHLRVVLAATLGVPLDTPAAPALSGPAQPGWLPVLPPAALRELRVGLERLVPGAGLASAIAQPASAVPVERNQDDGTGRRRLLVPNPDPAATSATSGVLSDRQVGEASGSWQLAQLDWFGRWSSWARLGFGAGSRPRPPRPTLTLSTQPPAVGVPAPTGPLSGTVRIEVSVPPVEALPVGGRLLKQLALTTSGGAAPGTTVHPLADPANPPETLVITVPGPALGPTAYGTVTVTAVWSDAAGVVSDPSEPKTATLHDPRAPLPVVLPPTLSYTARPDSTGRARATLTWTPSAGQAAFRVFVADETTLRAKLSDIAAGRIAPGDNGQAPTAGQAQAVLDALTAAPDAPTRGAVWDAHRQLLPRRWWLQLTGAPVPAPSAGPVSFHHDVSGSLQVLVLYRIVAQSAASVETDFASSPLLPRAVPNLLTPPEPGLAVRPVTDGSGNLQAELTITVPPGATPAARFRLRRATTTTDTLLMPIVAVGTLPPRPPGDPAPQLLVFTDTGTTAEAVRTSLVPWVRYHWRVEVQGDAAPGGGPVGEWSTPSLPASAVTMPPDPPVAVTDLTTDRDAAGVHVRFRQPEPLTGGASQGYAVDVYRQRPGELLRLLTSVPGQAPPPVGRGTDPTGWFDVVDPDPSVPAGTGYRVAVTDPIGRASAPSPLVVAP